GWQGGTPPGTWGFFASSSAHPNGEPGPNSEAGKKAGFCPGCNAGFSVLFSDGRGIDGWKNCDSSGYLLGTLDPSFPAYCKNGTSPYAAHDSKPACSATSGAGYPGLGAEKDGDDFLSSSIGVVVAQLGASGGTIFHTSDCVVPTGWTHLVPSWVY